MTRSLSRPAGEPSFAATCWTLVKFAAVCAAAFAALSAIVWLGLVIWLSTAL